MAASSSSSSSSSSSDNNKCVKLKTSDHKEFVVDQIVAVQSQTIKNMIESDCAADVIPLPNVDGSTLSLIITYCQRHASASSDAAAEKELKRYDEEFARKLSLRTRFNVLMAANFLDIKDLLDITIEAIADGIKDMPHQEVRAIFNIENDYTPEEEAQVRAEYAWAFDKFP